MKTLSIEVDDDYVKPELEGGLAWVDALKSGKYKKGENFLHHGDRYCCLGVKCDIDGILDGPFARIEGMSANQYSLPLGHPWAARYQNQMYLRYPVNVRIQDEIGHDMRCETIVDVNDNMPCRDFTYVVAVIEAVWELK